MPKKKRREVLETLTLDQLIFLKKHWGFWARPDQLPPEGDWLIWLLLGGRGAGKTRAGAEWVRSKVEGPTPLQKGKYRHIALVGETILSVREVMIEGPSGLRAIAPEETRPTYIASRQLLVWPNGAQAKIFSAEKPDGLRGPQFDLAWCDELAKWRYDKQCWDMLQFALRLGRKPQQVVTTTPRPTALLKTIMNNPRCHMTRSSTHANKAHLAPGFVEELMRAYEGSRLGRQEIDAEIVEEVVGALWTPEMIGANRLNSHPPLKRLVVAVDPPASTGPLADACGICVAGKDDDGHAYILEDGTVKGLSPAGWGRRVWINSEATLYVMHTNGWQSITNSGGATGQGDLIGSNGLDLHVEEIDHIVTTGMYNDTALNIPSKSTVLAITGRVLTPLGGSRTWKLGVVGGEDRYGNQIGYQKDSTVVGVSSSPVTYYADTPIRLTAVSGQFSDGKIRLKLYVMKFALPEKDLG